MKRIFRPEETVSGRRIRNPARELGRIASFRVLLWWGVQTTLEILRIRKPEAQIVHVSKTDLRFPVSSWFLADEKAYCIVSPNGQKEVTIFAFLSGGKDEMISASGNESEKVTDGCRF